MKIGLQQALSYRFDITLQIIYVLFQVAFILIFTRVVSVKLGKFSELTYFEYLASGYIFHNLLFLPRGGLLAFIRSRSFPMLFISPHRLSILILGFNSFRILWSLFIISIMFTVFTIIGGLNIPVLSLQFFVLMLVSFITAIALDLFASGFRLATKSRHDPLNLFIDLSSQLLSGLYFPVEYLPTPLKEISLIHPERYILTCARMLLTKTAFTGIYWQVISTTSLVSLIFLIIGYLVFKWGLKISLSLGTIDHY